MKMVVTVLNAGQYQSDAFASSLVRNVNDPDLLPLSHTASNATRTHPITMRTIAPCGRFAAGVLPLTMHTMTVPLLTTDVL
jgi:hypothetical protein